MGTIWGDVERVVKGEYDYYGGVDDNEAPNEGQPRFFVKKSVWAWCQKQKFAASLDGYLKQDGHAGEPVESAKELLAVFRALSMSRRSPLTAWHAIGGQVYEEELDTMAAVQALAAKELKAFRADWDELP